MIVLGKGYFPDDENVHWKVALMNRLGKLSLTVVSLLTLAACGGYQAAPPVPTPTRFIAFTLPPSWTPEPSITPLPTRQVTKAPPTATVTVTPTIRRLAPPTALPPTATLADPTRSTINGSVVDSLGKPMANIKVELATQAAPTQVIQTATSGPDGRFELTKVAPGSYRVQTVEVTFKSSKCIATTNTTVTAGGMRLTIIVRFAPTCR
jgi:5-hydroxyisourate hydrolase-like protein (transthyretin family)